MNDREFLQHHRRSIRPFAPGTLAWLDADVAEVLDRELPVWMDREFGQRELATHWLRQQRPRSFFAMVRWGFRLLLEVFRP